MAIGPVVTRGYTAIGSIALVVLRGYTSAPVTVPTQAGPFWLAPDARVEFIAPDARPEFTARPMPGGG